jgi:hypothetical protein
MTYFLIVYDRTKGKTIGFKEFDSASADLAFRERSELELKEKDHPHIEVIVLGPTSLDALKRTHSRYFTDFSSLEFPASAVEDFEANLKNLESLTGALQERPAS